MNKYVEEIKGHIVSNIFELLMEQDRLSLDDIIGGINNIVDSLEKIIEIKLTTLGDAEKYVCLE